MDSEDILNIKRVAVWDVTRAINARNPDVGWAPFYGSVSFDRGSRLDKLAINFKFSIYGANLMHCLAFISFVFDSLWLPPGRYHHVLGLLAHIEFVERVRGTISKE